MLLCCEARMLSHHAWQTQNIKIPTQKVTSGTKHERYVLVTDSVVQACVVEFILCMNISICLNKESNSLHLKPKSVAHINWLVSEIIRVFTTISMLWMKPGPQRQQYEAESLQTYPDNWLQILSAMVWTNNNHLLYCKSSSKRDSDCILNAIHTLKDFFMAKMSPLEAAVNITLILSDRRRIFKVSIFCFIPQPTIVLKAWSESADSSSESDSWSVSLELLMLTEPPGREEALDRLEIDEALEFTDMADLDRWPAECTLPDRWL